MNRALRLSVVGLAVAFALAIPRTAQATSIVINGGFETGDLTGWVAGGFSDFTGVAVSPYNHGGTFGAFAGPFGSNGTLTQTLTTTPGSSYNLSFWLTNIDGGDNFFSATWGGLPALITQSNSGAFGYTQFQFAGLVATGALTALTFTFRNEPGFYGLDDVAVEAVPEPASMLLLGTGVLGLAHRLRRRNQK